MEYPKVIDENPLHIDAKALHEAVNRYYDDPIGDRVALAIASYANSNGEAFPGFPLLAELTGYTYEQISRATHRLQALGILTIKCRRSKGAEHAHDVYKFCKRLIRKVIDICSAHFIANVKKWRAEAKDVAAAVLDHAHAAAKKALDSLTEKAAKMAAVFQEQPELLESPEQAAQAAGIVETEPISEPTQWEDAPAEPVAWENGDAITGTLPASSAPVGTIGDALASETVGEPPRVFASWRDRVAAYRKETAAA